MKKSLKDLFDNYFQGEQSFNDFINEENRAKLSRKYVDGRLVHIADNTYKDYLSFINFSIGRHLRIVDNAVFSYRKNKNIADAVRAHTKGRYFYQTDLENSFSSIDTSLLESALRRSVDDLPFIITEYEIKRVISMISFEGTLPAGLSTSPCFSNAALYDFDSLFLSYCEARNVAYTRYSDDIIISAAEEDILATAIKTLKLFFLDLYGRKFSFNPNKTKLLRQGRKVKLLGLNILPNESIAIDKRLRNKIETTLHYYTTNPVEFIELTKNMPELALQRLGGYLSFVASVDQKYLEKLQRKYGAVTIKNLTSNQNSTELQ